MSVTAALTIIAIVMILLLLIVAVTAAVLVRTSLRLERLLARAEQDAGPLIFDIKVALADIKRMTQSGRLQMQRVDYTLKYLSDAVLDASDAVLRPVQELRTWYRAIGTGLRYFLRRR